MKRRKDGRYMKQIYIGKKKSGKIDENGNQIFTKQYRAVYGNTKREVEEKAYELSQQIKRGEDFSSTKGTFGVWAEKFMDYKVSEGIGYSHIQGLRNFIRHLEPIHHLPIEKVEIQDIREIILDLYSETKDKSGNIIRNSFSKRTLSGIRQCARQIFNFAIESRVIEYNPAVYVKIPKDAHKVVRGAITEEQQCWINSFDHRAKRAAMLMLHAGLRRGEVTALTWGDIDLVNSTIQVTQSVEFISGQASLKSTKTTAGERIINIPTCLIKYLSHEKEKDSGIYVVHMHDGHMMSKIAWKRMWDSYMRDLNVEYGYLKPTDLFSKMETNKVVTKFRPGGLEMRIQTFTPHQLRHTFASNCYLAGVDVQTCMEWMGHRDIQTTLGIYTHLSKSHKNKTVSKLDDFYASNRLISMV